MNQIDNPSTMFNATYLPSDRFADTNGNVRLSPGDSCDLKPELNAVWIVIDNHTDGDPAAVALTWAATGRAISINVTDTRAPGASRQAPLHLLLHGDWSEATVIAEYIGSVPLHLYVSRLQTLSVASQTAVIVHPASVDAKVRTVQLEDAAIGVSSDTQVRLQDIHAKGGFCRIGGLVEAPSRPSIAYLQSDGDLYLECNANVERVYWRCGTVVFGDDVTVGRVTRIEGGAVRNVPIDALVTRERFTRGIYAGADQIVPLYGRRRYQPLSSVRWHCTKRRRAMANNRRVSYGTLQANYSELARVLTEIHAPGSTLARAREEEKRARLLSLPLYRPERWLLSAYSIIGYGERASMPIAVWVITFTTTALLMKTVGGIEDYAFWRMLAVSAAAPLEFLKTTFDRPNVPGFGDGFIWTAGKLVDTIAIGTAVLSARRLVNRV